MRKLSLALVMAAGLLFSIGSGAQAAVVTDNAGTLDATHPFASYGYDPVNHPDFHLDNSGHGQFRIDFALGSPSGATASSLTATAVLGTALKDFTFGLYDSANHLLKQVDQNTAISPDGHTTVSAINFANLLQTGSYYLMLVVTAGNSGQVINGNIAIAAVPVPAALPMFGLVLAGLMAMQMRRRKQSSNMGPMA